MKDVLFYLVGTHPYPFVLFFIFSLNASICLNSPQIMAQPVTFMKDVLFYLVGVAAVFACLLDGQLYTWECVGIGLLYVMYVSVTLYVAQGEEPVHADQARDRNATNAVDGPCVLYCRCTRFQCRCMHASVLNAFSDRGSPCQHRVFRARARGITARQAPAGGP